MATKKGRISESDLLLPTLRILAHADGGKMSTSQLIKELTAVMKPTGEDAEILDGRHDTRFSQIVRNMVSHKTSPENIIAQGFVTQIYRGLKISEAGLAYLKKKGG